MLRARRMCVVLGFGLLLATGCEKRTKATIVSHPEWQYQDYHRVAILPFQVARPESVESARQAEFYLTDLLTQNGAFQVLTRSDIGDVMTEQDLSRLADVSDQTTTLPEGKIQAAQALIIGKITEFELKREANQVRRPRYATDRRGMIIRDRSGRPVVTGEDVIVEYRHVARVGGSVRVIDAVTGRVLVSRSVPALEKDDRQWNNPPGATPEQLAEDVAREVATEFYKMIAPISIELKLSKDCLTVATSYYEGRYQETTKIATNLPEILLVARDLPKQCDRNEFRLAISPKDGRDYVVDQSFTWSPSLGHRGVAVQVPMSTLTAGGREFTAKLFAAHNDQPILQRDFKLVEPKTD